MRALLALMVVLLLVLGGLFYLFGNPLEMLAEPPEETADMRDGQAGNAAPVVAASGPVLDATPQNITPSGTPEAGLGAASTAMVPSVTPAAGTESAPSTSAPAVAVLAPPAPASEPVRVEAEARQFLETLTEPAVEPVAVAQADHFVRADQEISMVPTSAIETTTLEALKQDEQLAPDTPITVVRTVEQIEATTPQRVIAESEGNLDAPIRVLGEDRQIKETTVREVLEQQREEPSTPIMVVREVEHYEITTIARLEEEMRREQASPTPLTTTPAPAAALAAPAASVPETVSAQTGVTVIATTPQASTAATAGDPLKQTIRVIREPYKVSRATVAQILESRNETVAPDSVFYVRTVRASDAQGIWGIVQEGIAENFARGVALRRGEEINTFRVDIPGDADELQSDRSSSFLGRLIYDKSRESHVYNYRLNRMGQSPDRIYPGQELVIIQFHPDELVSIYRHFVEQRG